MLYRPLRSCSTSAGQIDPLPRAVEGKTPPVWDRVKTNLNLLKQKYPTVTLTTKTGTTSITYGFSKWGDKIDIFVFMDTLGSRSCTTSAIYMALSSIRQTF